MGQDPDEIRREIEATRAEMSETVGAIGYRADVKARTRDRVTDARDSIVGRVSGATPDTGEAKHKARRAAGVAQENPVGLALGSVAVGFLAGLLVPSTELEDEKVGPLADQVKERARETGQEALERGREVAQEAAQSAKETAQESGQQHAQEVASSAKDAARQTRDQVRSSPQGA
jgi:ElaB/YqjD/DUF883 family membrane-anchored ribosome-binding protein